MELVADLHTHTVASGHAYSTVNENISAARKKGIKIIAITDHGPCMPGGPHLYHFGNLKVLPRNLYGVEVFYGVEANVLDFKGGLDLPENYLDNLDIILAGFHNRCYPGGTVEQNTKAMINTMRNPWVDIIVHPGNPQFAVEPREIVTAAVELGVVLEINNSSLGKSREGSYDNCLAIAREAARTGANVVVGSDAHWLDHVGEFSAALNLLKKAGVVEEQIINTSVSKVKTYLQNRRKKRRDSNF